MTDPAAAAAAQVRQRGAGHEVCRVEVARHRRRPAVGRGAEQVALEVVTAPRTDTMPALLTRTSSPPPRSSAVATTAAAPGLRGEVGDDARRRVAGIAQLRHALVRPVRRRGAHDDRGTARREQPRAGHPDPGRRAGTGDDRGAAGEVELPRQGGDHPQETAAVKDSSSTSMPSWSRSSEIDSGGRNRKTFPYVPQVSVTRPRSWQPLLTAAVSAEVGLLGLGVGDELHGDHRAPAPHLTDLVVLLGEAPEAVGEDLPDRAGATGEVLLLHRLDRRPAPRRTRRGCRRRCRRGRRGARHP